MEGFKTGGNFFRIQRNDLVTDARSKLVLWKVNFSSLLNGKESARPENGEPDYPFNGHGKDVSLPDYIILFYPSCYKFFQLSMGTIKKGNSERAVNLTNWLLIASA